MSVVRRASRCGSRYESRLPLIAIPAIHPRLRSLYFPQKPRSTSIAVFLAKTNPRALLQNSTNQWITGSPHNNWRPGSLAHSGKRSNSFLSRKFTVF